jgi:hypothetical protein
MSVKLLHASGEKMAALEDDGIFPRSFSLQNLFLDP